MAESADDDGLEGDGTGGLGDLEIETEGEQTPSSVPGGLPPGLLGALPPDLAAKVASGQVAVTRSMAAFRPELDLKVPADERSVVSASAPIGEPPSSSAFDPGARTNKSTASVDEDDEPERAPTAEKSMLDILQAKPPDETRSARKTLRMARLALTLVWRGARWRGVAQLGLGAFAGAGIGAQLLVGNDLLSAAIAMSASGTSVIRLWPQVLTLIAVSSVIAFAGAVQGAQSDLVRTLVGAHVDDELAAATSAVGLIRFEDSEYYDRVQRATAGGQIRPMQLLMSLSSLVGAALGTVGIGVALLTIEPLLVPLAALAAVPPWQAARKNAVGRRLVVFGNTPEERERSYLRQLLTTREPAAEVRAFGLVDFLQERLRRVVGRIIERQRGDARNQAKRTLLGQALGGVGSAIGGIAVLVLLADGRLGVAGAVTAALALQQLRGRITAIGSSSASLYESGLYLDDYASFVEDVRASESARPTDRPDPGPFRELRAHHVTFSYPGAARPALADVDVNVGAGEVVALVGENGSGKTTLAKVLCGLYEPDEGAVTWDGIDVREWPPNQIRQHITVLFQDFVRYALPARDNVGLGRHQRIGLLDDITAATDKAGLTAVLEGLPDGFDTVLGRQFMGGQDLSGGQWQRMALARAFFRDAPFLVMDEPTAALDARAEYQLFQRIRELGQGRSVLLITHRFANVRMADRIYVLHRGRVVEHGSHAELVELNGRYAELYELQASQFRKP